MGTDYRSRCNVGRVPGINHHIIHSRNHSSKHHIPVFRRIFIYADLHRAEHINLRREFHQRISETFGNLAAFFRGALKFELYSMIV